MGRRKRVSAVVAAVVAKEPEEEEVHVADRREQLGCLLAGDDAGSRWDGRGTRRTDGCAVRVLRFGTFRSMNMAQHRKPVKNQTVVIIFLQTPLFSSNPMKVTVEVTVTVGRSTKIRANRSVCRFVGGSWFSSKGSDRLPLLRLKRNDLRQGVVDERSVERRETLQLNGQWPLWMDPSLK